MEAVGPSVALALAAWLLLQLLERRHAATHTRYRELVGVFRHGVDTGSYRKRVAHMLCATNIGMTAAFLLLLSLMISTLDAVSRADWLKLFGAPASMLRLLLVIPAAILVIMENMMNKKRADAGLADLDELNGQPQAGTAQHIPERRRRERRPGSALLQPRGA